MNYRNSLNTCSKEVFHIIMQRERSRADRNGHPLTLVLFDLEDGTKNRSTSNLVGALKTRLRTIDRFGFYSSSQIGVILPNTSYNGGTILAKDICNRVMTKQKILPQYRIFTYPDKWLIDITSLREKKITNETTRPRFIDGSAPHFVKNIPFWKRLMDIVGASVFFILSLPCFIFIPLLIKLTSRGPIFFKQERVGQGGRLFTFLKFRTMYMKNKQSVHIDYLTELIKSDKPMTKLDSSNDPRIIPLGRFIRKSCIDEIPQLFNVLKGDMSLVGPRPCLPYEVKEYLKWHRYRMDVRPGMTGLWQVSGKNRLTFQEMIRLDILYAEKMSFFFDLKILVKTLPAIVTIIADRIHIDSFYNRMQRERVPREQFKEFIRKYYSDIYNVDRLEFIDDKIKDYHIDLMELMMLLTKLHRLTPTYNVAKRYFGICKLIDTEKKAQVKAGQT
ncbi:MAG: sugar transferase [Spirochaetota bacterium]